jgi:MFS family permease
MSTAGPPPLAGSTVLWCIAFYGGSVAAFGLSGSFLVAIFFLTLSGAADGVSTVVRQTLRQLLTPDDLRGRMTAVNMIFFMGGPQLGEFEAGTVARFCGARGSVVSGGVLCVLLAAAFTLLAPRLRAYRLERGA